MGYKKPECILYFTQIFWAHDRDLMEKSHQCGTPILALQVVGIKKT